MPIQGNNATAHADGPRARRGSGLQGTQTYLDYNASAPLIPEARAAMVAALDNPANASSVHGPGRDARRIIEAARRDVAALCGGRPEHVVFTSGATEAASFVLTPRWRMGRAPTRYSRLYTSAADHPCVISGGRFEAGEVVLLPVDSGGVLDHGALEAALAGHEGSQGLPLVALHHANNETGVIQPIERVGETVRKAGGLFVVDAVQAAGRLPLDRILDHCDFVILSSHKIGGPKGAGALVGRSEILMPEPLLRGGGHEKGHRAGTENMAAIAGFGAAARVAVLRAGEGAALLEHRHAFEAAVLASFPGAVIHGRGAERLANTVFFSVPRTKAETLQIALDLAGVAVSAGSACSSGKVGPSHVLRAMGLGEDASAIRVSFGHETGAREVERLRDALEEFARRRSAA